MISKFLKRRTEKAHRERQQRDDEEIRFNSPFCPRCQRSMLDMPRGSLKSVAGTYAYHLRCDACNRASCWIDTGFMGAIACVKGGKEYQLAKGRDDH